MLYFTELKSQRAFKRERRGGGCLLFPRSIFFASLSVTLQLQKCNAAFVSPSLLDIIKVGT